MAKKTLYDKKGVIPDTFDLKSVGYNIQWNIFISRKSDKTTISDAFYLKSVYDVNIVRSLLYGINYGPREIPIKPWMSLKLASQ